MSVANDTKADRKPEIRICSAFMTLLKTIPYEKISISRLCQEAGVSRQTFYKNFESLGSVASYQLQQLANKNGMLAELESYKMQHLADILDNIPMGVCVLFMPDDMHQEIRFANKQMMSMINPNMNAPEKVSPQLSKLRAGYYKNAFSGVHPDDLSMAIATFREGFHLSRFNVKPLRLMTSTGDYIWVVLDVIRREDLPDGRLFYASYRDVSKEMQLKKELEAQEQRLRLALAAADKANEAKSSFLSSMSHDLRTPLNGIIGYTALALQEKDTIKKQDFLRKIEISGNLL